jgi:hypothetical protein
MCALGRDDLAVVPARAAVLWLLLAFVAACGDGKPAAPGAAKTRAPEAAAPAAGRPNQARPPRHPRAWTQETVLRRLDGRRIIVAGKALRLDGSTLVCGGVGRPARRRGSARWTRFRCLQPTFPPGAVAGPDAVFLVEPASGRRLVVRDARFTGY